MGPYSWRFSQYPIQKTGSGALDPLTQLTCLPDLAPIVTRSTPDSGCMAVSYLRNDQLGPQHSSSLWHPYKIRQHHPHNSNQPIPGSDHQPSGTQPELLRGGQGPDFHSQGLQSLESQPYTSCNLEHCQNLHLIFCHQVSCQGHREHHWHQ